jgi:hypothetical protein
MFMRDVTEAEAQRIVVWTSVIPPRRINITEVSA